MRMRFRKSRQAEQASRQAASSNDAMRFCGQCGKPAIPGARFCGFCGSPINGAPESDRRIPSDQYAFIDVETPNRRNDRICSIGIVRTDSSGNILAQKYMLVDPDTDFDPINTSIHGITEFDVHGAPSFPDAWSDVRPLLIDAKIVAHNAQFDLTVLDKTLSNYEIEHGNAVYACTMTMASSQLRDIGSYKLDVVCQACGVPLKDHHNAMEDAQACKEVFFSLEHANCWMEYVPIASRQPKGTVFNVARSEHSKAHNELMKHAVDILEDGHVSLDEAIGLRWWVEKNANLSGDATSAQLLALLSGVLEDGKIDQSEEAEVMELLKHIVNPALAPKCSDLAGKKFCLTGDFDFGTREEVIAYLEGLGGISSKSVTKTCDFVIIGSQGSAAYAHGNYGSKVRKAMEWQAKGVPMQIMTEQDCPWL